MTENEAIERIKYRMHTAGQVTGESGMEDLEMAIKALEEEAKREQRREKELEENPLLQYSTSQLKAELRRRKREGA